MPDDIRRLKELFGAVAELPIADRPSFLDRQCGTDTKLRQQVEALLQSHDSSRTYQSDGTPTPATGDYNPNADDVEAEQTTNYEPTGLPGVVIAARYTLVESIGEGGMGEVWVAKQSEPVKRRVALKLIKAGMDSKAVLQRFEAERQALALMDHQHIARVFDGGMTEERRPFFAMELVNGLPINKFCDEAKLGIRQRLELFVPVCQAVQHAHQKGIIHRDLKPSNILVTIIDGNPIPKIIDFGVAKAMGGKLTDESMATQFGAVIGTLEYMAPEQAAFTGADVDTRADIYSLGVILYELLTGLRPIGSKQSKKLPLTEMIRIIHEDEPSKPSTRLSTEDTLPKLAAMRHIEPRKLTALLRGELDWIVMKCLEKDRSRRYETANGLARDIQRYLAGDPIEACPPSAGYKLRKLARKHRAAIVTLGAFALFLIVATAVSAGLALWANRERNRAESAERVASTARTTAMQQRDLAQDQLYESLVREARFIRTQRRLGYRRELFDRLRQAAALSTENRNVTALRSEASRGLGDPVALDPVPLTGNWTAASVGDERAPVHAIHPWGTVVARGTFEGKLTLYDAETGNLITSLDDQGSIVSLTFGNSGFRLFGVIEKRQDGSSTSEMSVAEWRREGSGGWIRHATRPTPGLRSFFETTKGVIAATSKNDGAGFVMTNLETGAIIGTVPQVPLALAEDRRLVALRSDDANSLIVWDLDAGISRISLESRASRLRDAAFNDDGSYLASQSQTDVVVYETQKFDKVSSFRGYFLQIAFLDRKTLAIPLPQEESVRFYNIGSNSEVARLSMGAWDVRIARESRSVFAFGRKPQVVRLGNTSERRRLLGHDGGVPCVEFTPDGTRLVSIGKDRTVRFWDAATGNQINTQVILETPGQGVAFTPDGRYLATCEWNGSKILIWSTTNNQVVLTLNLPTAEDFGGYAISFNHDGRYLGVGGPFGLHLWELKSSDNSNGNPLQAQKVYSTKGVVYALQFDQANKWLAYSDIQPGQEGTYLMRLDKLNEKPERVFNRRVFVQSVGILPRDGAFASMVGGRDKSVEFWNPETKIVTRTIPTLYVDEPITGGVNNFRISPDGSKLAVINATGRGVNVVEIATGRRLFALPDKTGTVWWFTWSPDSTRLVVSRSEGDISIWDLPKAQAVLTEAKLWDIDEAREVESGGH